MQRHGVFLLMLLGCVSAIAAPLSDEITYQGQLSESGQPADGFYDFEFGLFDVRTEGTAIVPVVVREDVTVVDGLFSVLLDFDAAAYTDDQLWLQVSVRPGASEEAFTELLPRQQLSASPYALHAQKVAAGSVTATELAEGIVGIAQIDTTEVQARIADACPEGSSIRSIDASGAVICQADTGDNLNGLICPPEEVAIGFSPTGDLQCTSPMLLGQSCPLSKTVDLVTPGLVDFIVVVDNSFSMSQETTALESSLNDMAASLDNLGTDYRIVMLTDHGPAATEVCVPPPLSGTSDCTQAAVSGPRFFHYDVNVLSGDSWCIVLDALYGSEPDESGIYPSGYISLLREDARKAFIQLSDDGVACTTGGTTLNDANSVIGGQNAATAFDARLLEFSSVQFGTQLERNYRFYGLIGVPAKNGDPTLPYDASDPVSTADCPTGVDPGTGYQWLSKGTDGLWFSQCATASYDSMLQQIASDASDYSGTSTTCSVSVESPQAGRMLDLSTTRLVYTPEGGGPRPLTEVAGPGACSGEAYYFDAEGDITICPGICAGIQADPGGSLTLDIDCVWPS
jgi:hypothetical protein